MLAGAAADSPTASAEVDEQQIRSYLLERRADGTRARNAVAQAADRFGIPKNRAYRLWLETRNGGQATSC